jgi:2-oxoglutarate ferredoxin oxidoreductase subunit alpha
VRWAGEQLDDAEVVVVAYGTAARVAHSAVLAARGQGIRAGLFRPITVWPYPEAALRALAERLQGVLVVELSAGQMVEDVRMAVEGRCPVAFHGRTGGMVPTPDEVGAALRELLDGGAA